jgi:hypothetical protein
VAIDTNVSKTVMGSQDDWVVQDCPHCHKCVTYSRKEAASLVVYRDATKLIDTLQADNAKLRAEVEGMRRDAARMDWLEKHCFAWTYDGIKKPYANVRIWMPNDEHGNQRCFNAHAHSGVGKMALREAIDAAVTSTGGDHD